MAKFPNIGSKHGFTALFSANDLPESRIKVPKKVIFVYSIKVFNNIAEIMKLEPFKSNIGEVGAIKLKMYTTKDKKLFVVKMPPGAALTAAEAEVLICAGSTEFLILGSAGGLGPRLRPGNIVICSKAIRDEGVSHHYLKSGMYTTPNKLLTKKLERYAKSNNIGFLKGPTWTIDAIFRETKEEVAHYTKIGVLTVEMEASALFAVAAKREVKAAAIFAISDILSGKEWSGFHDDRLSGYKKLAILAQLFRNIK